MLVPALAAVSLWASAEVDFARFDAFEDDLPSADAGYGGCPRPRPHWFLWPPQQFTSELLESVEDL